RYVVEPNVKEGKGGLRDLHTLYWIAKYLYRVSEPAELVDKGVLTKDEARHFERAERFLTTVRCHIHYLTGRADDRLSFDLQREIAGRLGYHDRPGSRGVERFTKHYYLHAKANRQFMAMLTSRHDPETTLRRLNEAGVFGRFVPDFGRVVAQTQHDMYHTYTVDEHTIRAIGILARIENGTLKEDHPLSADVVHKILSRPVLYLAVLLHDIAKGRGGDHSVLGAEIAMALGPRLGLSEAETETVAWLVRYHLAMSATAFQRDLMD